MYSDHFILETDDIIFLFPLQISLSKLLSAEGYVGVFQYLYIIVAGKKRKETNEKREEGVRRKKEREGKEERRVREKQASH